WTLQGRQRARQARRELHAERGRRRAQEAGALEDRRRLWSRWRDQGRDRAHRDQGRDRADRSEEVIAEFGHYALVLALGLALIQTIVPLWGARVGDATLMGVARSTALAQFVFVAASFGALTAAYVGSDFSVLTVFQNSHSMMPLIYKFTSVWGNHE